MPPLALVPLHPSRDCALTRGGSRALRSRAWQHNLHHACTNQVGVDEDIMSDPFFFLWPPDPSRDSKWRRLQHLYCVPVYASLFALWRFNSLRTIWGSRLRSEGALVGLNYLWIAACLPWHVAVGHVLLSGAMTALIVTVSHQAEDLHFEHQHDWVRAQVDSTRDALTSNPFSEWLWGGMQYQAIDGRPNRGGREPLAHPPRSSRLLPAPLTGCAPLSRGSSNITSSPQCRATTIQRSSRK